MPGISHSFVWSSTVAHLGVALTEKDMQNLIESNHTFSNFFHLNLQEYALHD